MADQLSYSMYVDAKEEHTEDLPPLEVSAVKKRRAKRWIDDDTTVCCYGCNREFGYFVRKHHCRWCGRIFCYVCSSNFTEAKDLPSLDMPHEPGKKFLSYIFASFFTNDKVRLCNRCNLSVKEEKATNKLVLALQMVDIKDIKKNVLFVSKEWNRAGCIVLSQFREIQYKLPFLKFSRIETVLLNTNKHFFKGHSVWIFQYIMSIDNWTNDRIDEVTEMLTRDKTVNCWNLMCSRDCKPQLSKEQALALLCFKSKLPECIVHILFGVIGKDLTEYYTFFVNTMVYGYLSEKTMQTTDFVFNSIHNLPDAIEFITAIDTFKMSDDEDRAIVIKRIRNDFISHLMEKDKSIGEQVKAHDEFLSVMEEGNIKKIRIHINAVIKTSIPYPFKPTENIVAFDDNSVVKKVSKCMPTVLPFGLTNSTASILHKAEDMRHDYIVSKAIKIMHDIICKEIGCTDNIVMYSIIPLNDSVGLIELVDDAVTINQICSAGKTIQNYILDNNSDMTVAQVRQKFMHSLAFYTVATYLLGINDRHMDNIMIHKSGSLFHIDFGYILGYDPKIAPYVRLTPNMIDAIGGLTSNGYQKFCELCSTYYNCLRRKIVFFSILLLQLNKVNSEIYSIDRIEKEVLKRFEPGVSDKDSAKHFSKLIEYSIVHSWKHNVIDYVHGTLKSIGSS